MGEHDESITTPGGDVSMTSSPTVDKGKGKAPYDTQAAGVEEDDDDSEEDEGDDEPIEDEDEEEAEDDDNMEEIDTANIITEGRRTRGKTIDFAKAAAESNDMEDVQDDEDEDEDFEAPDDSMQD